MSDQIAGLFELSVELAADRLFEHAKREGVSTKPERVKAILCDAIESGGIRPTRLVRRINGAIDVHETTIDPVVFLEHGQRWLCEHGLHCELGTNDYPEFPEVDADAAICEWLEGVLPELRTALLQSYEICDLRAHRVEIVLTALLCADESRAAEVDSIRTALRAAAIPPAPAGDVMAPRAEATYLNIIGALLELLLGTSPAGKPLSSFKTQTAVVEAILARHERTPGLSKRTLESRLALGKRNLEGT